MTADCWLVLLETSGNQAFIFSTNKLRDIIGGSEFIFRSCTTYLEETIQEVFGKAWSHEKFAENPQAEIPIGKDRAFEVLLSTSGKALLLVDSGEKAKALISAWSRIVLEKAPGLDALGVYSKTPVNLNAEKDQPCNLGLVVKEVHKIFEQARVKRTSVSARFQTLPVVQPCQLSGLPACVVRSENFKETYPISLPSVMKADARMGFYPRLKKSLEKIEECKECVSWKKIGEKSIPIELLSHPTEIEEGLEQLEWLAVLHADGNGLGKVFLNFGNYVKRNANESFGRAYIRLYREVSQHLDCVTQKAFCKALEKANIKPVTREKKQVLPQVPVVLGGDDLTVIMDGSQALDFAVKFLEEFSDCCAHDKVLSPLAKDAYKENSFGMAAGLCIIKPHFPFFTAYSFAEELIRSAKKAKQAVNPSSCALDFHILYDSSAESIESIRERMKLEDSLLTAKPFVVKIVGTAKDPYWCETHKFERFQNAVCAIKAEDDNKGHRKLPNSQAHAVREWLRQEKPETIEAEWGLMVKRYKLQVDWMEKDAKLFRETSKDTVFLDALEAQIFTTIGDKKEDETPSGNDPCTSQEK